MRRLWLSVVVAAALALVAMTPAFAQDRVARTVPEISSEAMIGPNVSITIGSNRNETVAVEGPSVFFGVRDGRQPIALLLPAVQAAHE